MSSSPHNLFSCSFTFLCSMFVSGSSMFSYCSFSHAMYFPLCLILHFAYPSSCFFTWFVFTHIFPLLAFYVSVSIFQMGFLISWFVSSSSTSCAFSLFNTSPLCISFLMSSSSHRLCFLFVSYFYHDLPIYGFHSLVSCIFSLSNTSLLRISFLMSSSFLDFFPLMSFYCLWSISLSISWCHRLINSFFSYPPTLYFLSIGYCITAYPPHKFSSLIFSNFLCFLLTFLYPPHTVFTS